MNNEPYGWVKNGEYVLYIDKPDNVFNYIPLYTHPVKKDEGKVCARCGAIAYDPVITQTVKELTDEEILDFINAFCLDMGDYWELTEKNAIPMIRAILRKAQEK